MRLSNKVLMTFSAIWILFLGIMYAVGHQYFMKSYSELEKVEIEKNVNRYHQHIHEILSAQGALAVDWGYWNEAYEFLAKPNPVFIEENFNYETFKNLSMSLILYVNKEGKVIYGMGADLQNEKLVPYTKDILKYLTPDSMLVKPSDDPAKSVTGLLNLPGLMLIVAAPVAYLYEGVQRPITGAVIMGRYYSQELLDKTAKAISIPLVIYTLDQIKNNAELEKIFAAALSSQTGSFTDLIDNKRANVYTLLKDINHQPIGMVELFTARDIYFAGIKSTNYYLSIFMLLGVISGILIWYLLRFLVLKRLENLNNKIMKITESHDYSHRITVHYHDEISFLTKQFNIMMQTVQDSHGQLSLQIQLLQESELRLEKLNATLKEEIKERKLAEEKVSALQSKLLLAARRAGMADIASGVLHNIGNILNSVVTSIGIVREKADNDKGNKLNKVVTLMNQHQHDLGKFFTEDPKAKGIPNYLDSISKSLQEDKDFILNEIAVLDKNMNMIKNVVSSQQSVSESIGIVEKVNLAHLVEDAIAVNKPLFEGTQVQIIREFSCDKIILIDRVKLLHIIVNLIKNSIESVLATHDTNKIITVRTEKHDETHIAIQIIDNGVGVPEENLEKIFSFGFTTKKTGHGFGMHTSANFTTEVGGKLVAESLGVNQGATMTLILPVAPEKKVKNTSDTSSHANAL